MLPPMSARISTIVGPLRSGFIGAAQQITRPVRNSTSFGNSHLGPSTSRVIGPPASSSSETIDDDRTALSCRRRGADSSGQRSA
jgi:hypothetical protein